LPTAHEPQALVGKKREKWEQLETGRSENERKLWRRRWCHKHDKEKLRGSEIYHQTACVWDPGQVDRAKKAKT